MKTLHSRGFGRHLEGCSGIAYRSCERRERRRARCVEVIQQCLPRRATRRRATEEGLPLVRSLLEVRARGGAPARRTEERFERVGLREDALQCLAQYRTHVGD